MEEGAGQPGPQIQPVDPGISLYCLVLSQGRPEHTGVPWLCGGWIKSIHCSAVFKFNPEPVWLTCCVIQN